MNEYTDFNNDENREEIEKRANKENKSSNAIIVDDKKEIIDIFDLLATSNDSSVLKLRTLSKSVNLSDAVIGELFSEYNGINSKASAIEAVKDLFNYLAQKITDDRNGIVIDEKTGNIDEEKSEQQSIEVGILREKYDLTSKEFNDLKNDTIIHINEKNISLLEKSIEEKMSKNEEFYDKLFGGYGNNKDINDVKSREYSGKLNVIDMYSWDNLVKVLGEKEAVDFLDFDKKTRIKDNVTLDGYEILHVLNMGRDGNIISKEQREELFEKLPESLKNKINSTRGETIDEKISKYYSDFLENKNQKRYLSKAVLITGGKIPFDRSEVKEEDKDKKIDFKENKRIIYGVLIKAELNGDKHIIDKVLAQYGDKIKYEPREEFLKQISKVSRIKFRDSNDDLDFKKFDFLDDVFNYTPDEMEELFNDIRRDNDKYIYGPENNLSQEELLAKDQIEDDTEEKEILKNKIKNSLADIFLKNENDKDNDQRNQIEPNDNEEKSKNIFDQSTEFFKTIEEMAQKSSISDSIARGIAYRDITNKIYQGTIKSLKEGYNSYRIHPKLLDNPNLKAVSTGQTYKATNPEAVEHFVTKQKLKENEMANDLMSNFAYYLSKEVKAFKNEIKNEIHEDVKMDLNSLSLSQTGIANELALMILDNPELEKKYSNIANPSMLDLNKIMKEVKPVEPKIDFEEEYRKKKIEILGEDNKSDFNLDCIEKIIKILDSPDSNFTDKQRKALEKTLLLKIGKDTENLSSIAKQFLYYEYRQEASIVKTMQGVKNLALKYGAEIDVNNVDYIDKILEKKYPPKHKENDKAISDEEFQIFPGVILDSSAIGPGSYIEATMDKKIANEEFDQMYYDTNVSVDLIVDSYSLEKDDNEFRFVETKSLNGSDEKNTTLVLGEITTTGVEASNENTSTTIIEEESKKEQEEKKAEEAEVKKDEEVKQERKDEVQVQTQAQAQAQAQAQTQTQVQEQEQSQRVNTENALITTNDKNNGIRGFFNKVFNTVKSAFNNKNTDKIDLSTYVNKDDSTTPKVELEKTIDRYNYKVPGVVSGQVKPQTKEETGVKKSENIDETR